MLQREILEETGEKILNNTRTELYLSMHFLGGALGSLGYIMDLSTTSVGTDAVYIRFNPNYLMENFIVRPRYLNRVYMHILMHCIFRHMFSPNVKEDAELWNLSCDIAVESVIDEMDYPAIQRTLTDKRAAIYEDLKGKVKVLTAERLYRYFKENPGDYMEQVRLENEFRMDDHSFWERLQDQEEEDRKRAPQGGGQNNPESNKKEQENNPKAPLLTGDQFRQKDEEWKKNARRMETEIETAGKEASDETGSIARLLSYELKERRDFREFLRKFEVLREEPRIDMDSFDYGFYNYGMQLYGNMPLIEENEYRISNKIEELVIAIDTSASTQKVLVQKFLNETASILLTGEHFFHRVEIHIVECDDRVQKDVVIHSPEEMRRYADGFELRGGYGTDFRPVFSYVEQLRSQGVLPHLKGLMYFTDGFGIYPKKPTDYDTAFVFWKDEDFSDKDVPDWAVKLYIKD